MAVDVDKFYTKEQDFGGAYKITDDIRQKKYRDEQLAAQQQGKKAAAGAFLNNYLDQKDYLTGTNYDPEIVKQLQQTMYEGAKLASEGADSNSIMMALSPKVARINEYSTKAKLVNQRLKDQMAQIKPGMGYDLRSLEAEAKKHAFYDEKGELRDITTIDPNVDYLTEAIKLYPERVTNDTAIDEFVKNSPKFTSVNDVSRYNANRGMVRNRAKVTSAGWQVPDVDERGATTGLVPKYETALENGQPLMHEFDDGKGGKVKAPVRMLEEGEFMSILKSNPGIADWLRGQIRQVNPDIDLNSIQAKNIGKAIMYDELKRRTIGGIEDIEVQKANPTIIKNYTGSSESKKGEDNMLDVYKEVVNKYDTSSTQRSGWLGQKSKKTLKLNSLSTIAQQSLLKQANTIAANTEENLNDPDKSQYRPFKQDDIVIEKDDNDNQLYMVDAKSKKRIAPIDFGSTNIVIQPGINEKRAVIKADKKLKTGSSTPTSSKSNMVTVVLENGVAGEIPESQVAQFLKDHPKAKRK